MGEAEIIPIWKKTGVVPSPTMTADRVHAGLLLSLLSRVSAVHSETSESFYQGLEQVIGNVITDEVSVDFSEDKKFIAIDILAKGESGIFGYTLYMPKYWLGQLKK